MGEKGVGFMAGFLPEGVGGGNGSAIWSKFSIILNHDPRTPPKTLLGAPRLHSYSRSNALTAICQLLNHPPLFDQDPTNNAVISPEILSALSNSTRNHDT